MAEEKPLHLKTELWRIGKQTDRKIETTKNYIMFSVLSDIHDIFSDIEVTDSTNPKDLIELLKTKTIKKMQEARHHWEINDPDN